MAVLAFSVAANLAVADFVMLIGKKALYLLPYTEKFSVFLSALVDVFGKISEH